MWPDSLMVMADVGPISGQAGAAPARSNPKKDSRRIGPLRWRVERRAGPPWLRLRAGNHLAADARTAHDRPLGGVVRVVDDLPFQRVGKAGGRKRATAPEGVLERNEQRRPLARRRSRKDFVNHVAPCQL